MGNELHKTTMFEKREVSLLSAVYFVMYGDALTIMRNALCYAIMHDGGS